MQKENAVKKAAKKILAISAIFLLGNTVANAAVCASSGNKPGVMAESFLKKNDSVVAFAWLDDGMNLKYGENDNYPPIGTEASGESYRKAAEMFETGHGVLPDKDKSKHLYKMAAQFWDAKGMFKTAEEYFLNENPKDGWLWLLRAVDCDQSDAVTLAVEQSIKEGNEDQARNFLRQGVRLNIPAVKHILADQYDAGNNGFTKDQRVAFSWYYSAAKDGYAKAMNAVAYYFFKGLISAPDELAALHWYHEAANKGDKDGMRAYAWLSANRKDGQTNAADSEYYFEKVAKNKVALKTK